MTDETQTFLQIRDYAWDTNAEFQSGLRTILASAPASHIDVLTNRAKCFYFQKFHPLTSQLPGVSSGLIWAKENTYTG
ncbi:hypothetical protein BDD12DRAFT_823968 [Trichophaea hybrida]|nr:hypothetical protein BDD12DRAFT_823968 [Trichophaea hybrida]